MNAPWDSSPRTKSTWTIRDNTQIINSRE
jgi:hypothetical protein